MWLSTFLKKRNQRFKWWLSLCLLLILVGGWLIVPQTIQKQIPLKRFQSIEVKDDRAEGGHSRIRLAAKGKNHLIVTGELNKGIEWPYAGVNLSLGDSTGKGCMDWTAYDSLSFNIHSSQARAMILIVRTAVPEDERESTGEVLRIQDMHVPAGDDKRTVTLALHNLDIPTWWRNKFNLDLLDFRTFNEKVCQVSLAYFQSYLPFGQEDSTWISSFTLSGKRSPALLVGSLLLILGFLLMFWALLQPQRFGVVATIKPKALEIKSQKLKHTEQINDFYASNYMNNELSMEDVARGVGLHPKKLQEVLRTDFRTTHKSLLTEYRLKEAQRLILETELPVGEIALEIGFNTISHFNRVFKDKLGKSPLEYRKSTQKD